MDGTRSVENISGAKGSLFSVYGSSVQWSSTGSTHNAFVFSNWTSISVRQSCLHHPTSPYQTSADRYHRPLYISHCQKIVVQAENLHASLYKISATKTCVSLNRRVTDLLTGSTRSCPASISVIRRCHFYHFLFRRISTQDTCTKSAWQDPQISQQDPALKIF